MYSKYNNKFAPSKLHSVHPIDTIKDIAIDAAVRKGVVEGMTRLSLYSIIYCGVLLTKIDVSQINN